MAVFPYFPASFIISAKPFHPSHSLMLCKAVPDTAFPSSRKWTDISIVSIWSICKSHRCNEFYKITLVGLYLWLQEQNSLFQCRTAFLSAWFSLHCAICSSSYLAGRGNERSKTFVWIDPRCFTCWNVLHRNMHALLHILWSIAKKKMYPKSRQQYKFSYITLALCSWKLLRDFLSVVYLF